MVYQILVKIFNLLTSGTFGLYLNHASVSGTATTVESTVPFSVAQLNVFANDGTDTIFLNFDSGTTTVNQIPVSAGETISDLPRTIATQLVVRSQSGSQPFRAWGVK